MTKYNIGDLKRSPKKNLLRNEITNSLKEVQKEKTTGYSKKIGRPQKNKEELLSKKITVNFTEIEEEKLLKLSRDYLDTPLPRLIRAILKEKGVI